MSREANDTERRTGIKKGHLAASHMDVEGDLPVERDLQKVQLRIYAVCPMILVFPLIIDSLGIEVGRPTDKVDAVCSLQFIVTPLL